MYGKLVQFSGFDVWVWCLPCYSEEKLRQLAEIKVRKAKSLGLKSNEFLLYLKDELQLPSWHFNS